MYFLAGVNIKYCCNIVEKKCFAPLRILYLFIQSLVSPFSDIVSSFFGSSFNSFSTSTSFI